MIRAALVALLGACLLALASLAVPARAQLVPVPCASLTAWLTTAKGGETVRVIGDCPALASGAPAVVLRRQISPPVTLEVGRATVAGLLVERGGGGLLIRGGTITAPRADGSALQVYGLTLRSGAANVAVEGTAFTAARKAVVIDQASDVALRFTRCSGRVEDCVIASRSARISYLHNSAGGFEFVPTSCTLPGGQILTGLSSRDCAARGGSWRDGWHPDVFQMRNAVIDVVVAFNRLDTVGQGFTQMDTTGDLPLQRILIGWNDIAAGRHGLTLGKCTGCRIEGNRLVTAVPGWRAQILPGEALACANDVPAGGLGREPCP